MLPLVCCRPKFRDTGLARIAQDLAGGTFVGPRMREDGLARFARQAGFTLIEILIALTIIAAVGALAMPPLARMYDRVTYSLAREDVEREIAGLGERARHEGHSLDLVSKSSLIALPSGWALTADPPIHYRFDGLCLGGRVTLDSGEQSLVYRLDPPFCRPMQEPS